MPGSYGLRILEFEKNRSWDLGLNEASRFSELAEARPVVCSRVPHVVGSDGKDRIERNCLSLFMSKNFKLKKVIKSFVPEPISCFSDSYMRIWTFFMYSYLGRIFGPIYYSKKPNYLCTDQVYDFLILINRWEPVFSLFDHKLELKMSLGLSDRHSCHNSHCQRKWTQWPEFKFKMRLFAFHTMWSKM